MSYALRWQRLGDGSIILTDGTFWDPDEPEIVDWFTEYYWKSVRDDYLVNCKKHNQYENRNEP